MTEQRKITERQLACLHEAGHFVLCWYFGFPPMTVTIGKTGRDITRSRKPIPVKPDQWRICLMGGYAAETLAMPPEQFLAYSDGLWGALKLPDRADTKKVAMHCKSASEYNGAFIAAHFILKHYEEQLSDAVCLLLTANRIRKADAESLYDRWKDADRSYCPAKEETDKAIRNARKQLRKLERQKGIKG